MPLYKEAGKTRKSFSQKCCVDEQGMSGCSQSTNQFAQHVSQSCGSRPPALGELGAGCYETLWFCQTQSELCSDLQPSPNKCLLPKITSGRSGCDWLWHCNLVQCQTLSYVELGLTLPPLTLKAAF